MCGTHIGSVAVRGAGTAVEHPTLRAALCIRRTLLEVRVVVTRVVVVPHADAPVVRGGRAREEVIALHT